MKKYDYKQNEDRLTNPADSEKEAIIEKDFLDDVFEEEFLKEVFDDDEKYL